MGRLRCGLADARDDSAAACPVTDAVDRRGRHGAGGLAAQSDGTCFRAIQARRSAAVDTLVRTVAPGRAGAVAPRIRTVEACRASGFATGVRAVATSSVCAVGAGFLTLEARRLGVVPSRVRAVAARCAAGVGTVVLAVEACRCDARVAHRA